jgi:hypothetical protein
MRCKRHGMTVQHMANAILNGQEGYRPLFSDNEPPGGRTMSRLPHIIPRLAQAVPLSSFPQWNLTRFNTCHFLGCEVTDTENTSSASKWATHL